MPQVLSSGSWRKSLATQVTTHACRMNLSFYHGVTSFLAPCLAHQMFTMLTTTSGDWLLQACFLLYKGSFRHFWWFMLPTGYLQCWNHWEWEVTSGVPVSKGTSSIENHRKVCSPTRKWRACRVTTRWRARPPFMIAVSKVSALVSPMDKVLVASGLGPIGCPEPSFWSCVNST